MVDFKSIDEKSNLAGSNRLEVLMFYLNEKDDSGNAPLYGINVFKIRELITLPHLIQKPNGHACAAGIANIRGKAVPVIDLQKYYGMSAPSGNPQEILIVTEFAGSMQGFIVNDVDKIVQLDWKDIMEPPEVVSNLSGINQGNTLTGISLLSETDMLMIIDVEQIIAEVLGNGRDQISAISLPEVGRSKTVLFVDDSKVARAQVRKMLEKMGFDFHIATNGKEALELLEVIAKQSVDEGTPILELITAIITDVEMPVMDGYMLTQSIKADERLKNIPVMMHSSLSAEETIRMGDKVGVDAYVPKLRPSDFSKALNSIISEPRKEAC